jgi:peptidoglycan/LPS O-acetylase OafA/YrhL
MQTYGQSSAGRFGTAFYALTGIGRQAVYVFFALSGFWVGGWTLRRMSSGTFGWSDHLIRRLSRLWTVLVPTLLLVLVVDLVGRAFFSDSLYYKGTAVFHGVAPLHRASHLTTGTFFGNLFFLQGHWVHAFGTDGPLWSLAYEFWYYLLFPALLALLFFARGVRRRLVLFLFVVAFAVAAGPEAMAVFPAWVLGVGAYVASRHLGPALERIKSTLLGAAQVVAAVCVLAACIVVQHLHAPAALSGLIASFAASVFLVFASVEVRPIGPLEPVLGIGGRIASFSYTLYAVHLPLLLLMCAFINPSGVTRPLGVEVLLTFGGLLLCVVLFAYGLSVVGESHTVRVRELAISRAVSIRARWNLLPQVRPQTADAKQPTAQDDPDRATAQLQAFPSNPSRAL